MVPARVPVCAAPQRWHDGPVRVTAKVDYAVRAVMVLARVALDGGGPTKGDQIGDEQQIPVKYLENILADLRQAGVVRSQRGSDGGYWLARPPAEVSIGDVIRAAEGPVATVRGERAENLDYPPGAEPIQELWVAVRASLRAVVDSVTFEDLVRGTLPDHARRLIAEPGAWEPR